MINTTTTTTTNNDDDDNNDLNPKVITLDNNKDICPVVKQPYLCSSEIVPPSLNTSMKHRSAPKAKCP